jgi:hypothetical protein
MKKLLYIVIFILLLPSTQFAQIDDQYWNLLKVDVQNFTAIADSFDNYLAYQYPDSIPRQQLPNIKDYYRFVNFWKSRLGSVNDTLSYLPYLQAAILNMDNPYCENGDPADWQLLGPTNHSKQILGLVEEVLADPLVADSYILSAENGGIWKSQATGNRWVNVTDEHRFPGLSATEIIRHPTNNLHLIASTGMGWHEIQYGMGIIESFDNGATWEPMDGFDNDNYPFVKKVIYDPYDDPVDGLTLWAITQTTNSGTIFVSYDTGLTWTEVTGPSLPDFVRYNDIEIARKDGQPIIFVGTTAKYNAFDGGLYKYENGAWYDLSETSDPTLTYQKVSISKADGGTIFVMLDNCNYAAWPRQIFRTTNYGDTWLCIKTIGPGTLSDKNKAEIEYSPNSEIVYIGSVNIGLIKNTTNFPLTQITLNSLTAHVDIRDIELLGTYTSNGEEYEKVLLATDGGISLLEVNTDDFTDRTLQNLNGNHLPIGNFMGLGASHSDDEFIVAGAVHNHTWRFVNGQWENFYLGDGGDSEVNWDNQQNYYYQGNASMQGAGGNPNLYYGANNWFIGMEYEFNPNDPYILYFGRSSKLDPAGLLVIWDQNTGQLVERIGPYNGTSNIDRVGAIGVNKDNIIFIADYNSGDEAKPFRFNKTLDQGVTWEDMSFKPVHELIGGQWVPTVNLATVLAWRTIEDIVFNPDDPDEMWISIGGISYDANGPAASKLKVLHSTDLGNSWYDYSENLSPFPVVALEYQLGSNKRLFAGTDAGVYYRDNTMSQWECFNEGLPICLISDLDYDPCNKNLYASTQGRGIFKTPVPFNDNIQTYLEPGQTIEWNTPRELANDLIIPETTTLTIRSNVYLSEGVKIIVEQGAYLVIDGGLLTNQCGDTWQGIEVWGDPTDPLNYGKILMNNSTIENAVVAVRMGSEDYTDKGGGRFNTYYDGEFLNNGIAIWFDPSVFQAERRIFNCNFDYTRTLTGEGTFTFVKINNVNGAGHVLFEGCSFTNNSNLDHIGIGIESVNSNFLVDGASNGTNALFQNLQYGIYATASTSSSFDLIEHSSFTNNFKGVYLSAMTNALVKDCEFDVQTPFTTSGGYGLYLDNCTAYTIEENSFTSSAASPTGVGLIVHNSGYDANEIYRNWFTNLEMGISAQELNRSILGPPTGLQIRCCEFEDCEADILVPRPQSKFWGIAPSQGANSLDPEDMAGNLFDIHNQIADGDFDDINNQGAHITYYYPLNSNNDAVEPVDYTTNSVTLYGILVDGGWTFETGCQPDDSSGSESEMRSMLMGTNQDIGSIEQTLNILIDGGDTESLYIEVETSLPPETVDVYNELMAQSPYLSDTVVGSAIEKEEVIPGAMLRDIMVANPHTAKSDMLMDKLDERFDPLPNYMKAQILAGRSLTSLKEELESKLAKYRLTKARAMKGLVHYYNNPDNVPGGADSIVLLLQQDGDLQSKYRLAMLQPELGNIQQAENILGDIPEQFNLTAQQLASLQDFEDFFALTIEVMQSDSGWLAINSGQIQQLTSLEQATAPASAWARNVLMMLDELEYEEPILMPDAFKSVQAEEAYQQILDSKAPSILEVYPNPAKDYFIVGYTLDMIEVSGSIEIKNLKGERISSVPITGPVDKRTVITKEWQSGTYVLSLMVDGIILESIKFTLID